MRRTGYLLAIAASIFLFNGCSGSKHDNHEDEAPVVQDLNIESEIPSDETPPAETPSDE